MGDNNIYIVNSYTNTFPGKMIRLRASMKFWNRYDGDEYSHVSLSRDNKLNNMFSFARKEINNPFNSGLIRESIYEKMFILNPTKSKIAVMKLPVTKTQYDSIEEIMNYYWSIRDDLGFNFVGLASMLFCARGVESKNNYFCSQWVATVLKEAGVEIFDNKEPYDIRPFDFYCTLKEHIIYEGLTINYDSNKIVEENSKVLVKHFNNKI